MGRRLGIHGGRRRPSDQHARLHDDAALSDASPRLRLDKATYASCPGPLDPAEKEKFSAHGLSLRPGGNGVHTVYMVHHGFRESVEVFELDARPSKPTLTWTGCVVAPREYRAEFGQYGSGRRLCRDQPRQPRRRPVAGRNITAGGNTGELWEWNPKDGWKMVPGSESPTPNGIEVSKDGKWYYVNLWAAQKVMRLSRGVTPPQKDVVDVPFTPITSAGRPMARSTPPDRVRRRFNASSSA